MKKSNYTMKVKETSLEPLHDVCMIHKSKSTVDVTFESLFL